MLEELWKPIEEIGKGYEVSNFGRIRRIRYIKPCPDKDNYNRVGFYVKRKIGKTLSRKISRLVAIAFLPNPSEKPEVNHKDGNKQNDHVDNLEWGTASENSKHAFMRGLKNGMSRNKHPMSKVSEEQSRIIYERYNAGEKQKDLAKEFGMCQSGISYVVCSYRKKLARIL